MQRDYNAMYFTYSTQNKLGKLDYESEDDIQFNMHIKTVIGDGEVNIYDKYTADII